MANYHSHGRRSQPARASWRPFVIALVGALMIGAVALSVWGRARPTVSGAADGDQIAQGRQLYVANCAACHGLQLEGQPNWQAELPAGGRLAPPHDRTGHTWHHPDPVLFDITKRGGQASSPPGYRNNMPGFGASLSDSQIWAVLAYIKSTWPADIRTAQQRVTQQTQ